ncbi:cytochrome P450 [Mycena floridula]|nr:cytochrome P450 [Mycena floridula]
MALVAQLTAFNLFALGLSSWIIVKLIRKFIQGSYGTPLRGPTESPSFFYGYQAQILESDIESAKLYQGWAAQYGRVFSIPWAMGKERIILMDPKAISHFFARAETGYTQPGVERQATINLIGHGILSADGDVHRRQRKYLSPSFSNATIRGITSAFYDAGYKVKAAWDSQIDASNDDCVTIEVQKWMTAVALDSIGMGGFSHNFGTVEGKEPLISTAFDTFGKSIGDSPSISPFSFLVGAFLPILMKLPIGNAKLVMQLKANLTTVGSDLIERVQKEQQLEGTDKARNDKSIIGGLIRSQDLSKAEIQGQVRGLAFAQLYSDSSCQMNTLLIAGYITTATSMTWALVELAKSPEKQTRLREELLSLGPNDPTFDQLSSVTTLPYLDAITHEILRLHPAVAETPRQCTVNDIMPLSSPITTRDGQVVSSLSIPKGALVVVPLRAINTSEMFWGPDAEEFRPERWLESEADSGANDIQSYRHILTFITGPRECLGKTFALTEFKSVLSVIIRNYILEFPDGPKTKVGQWRGILSKANVEGEVDGRVPIIVRRVN